MRGISGRRGLAGIMVIPQYLQSEAKLLKIRKY